MKSVTAQADERRLGEHDLAARKRAAVETYAQSESILRRTARRYSLCADDADDALQRSFEILLRKAPTDDQRQLIKWMQTVVKHEAMAIRRDRERTLAGPAAAAQPDAGDWVSQLPAATDGPPEHAERREAIVRSREALQGLKPQELRALTLLAQGYSYVEIGEMTGYSQTKINRCLAEGRERFRRLFARSEAGERCAELLPLLSSFCDGELAGDEATKLREHLRACTHCRATLRAYRAAPAAAAALTPTVPLGRSLFERAHDALSNLAARFGVGSGVEPAIPQAAGGASGLGAATLAKVAAVCIGTAGGAGACLASGLVPAPIEIGAAAEPSPRLERTAELPPETESQVAYEPAPVSEEPAPVRPDREEEPREPEPTPAETAPASSGGAVEYQPPPAPEAAPAPAPVASSSGSPAGEFGP